MVYRGCFNCDQGSQRPALVFLVQNVHLNRHNRHRNQEEHDPEYFSHPVCRRHYPPAQMCSHKSPWWGNRTCFLRFAHVRFLIHHGFLILAFPSPDMITNASEWYRALSNKKVSWKIYPTFGSVFLLNWSNQKFKSPHLDWIMNKKQRLAFFHYSKGRC